MESVEKKRKPKKAKTKKEKKAKKEKKQKKQRKIKAPEQTPKVEEVKTVDLKPEDALKIIQALAKKRKTENKDNSERQSFERGGIRERSRYRKDDRYYDRDRRASYARNRNRSRSRSRSRGHGHNRSRSRSRSRERHRRARSGSRRSRSRERRHSRDRDRRRYTHSPSPSDRKRRASLDERDPPDLLSSKIATTRTSKGQSILSSIHNERAATVELKGDKQQESMVYTASSKKEGRGSAKDGGEFLKINRPYKCLVCDLRFCVSLQVAEHMRTAHGQNVQPWRIRPSKE